MLVPLQAYLDAEVPRLQLMNICNVHSAPRSPVALQMMNTLYGLASFIPLYAVTWWLIHLYDINVLLFRLKSVWPEIIMLVTYFKSTVTSLVWVEKTDICVKM